MSGAGGERFCVLSVLEENGQLTRHEIAISVYISTLEAHLHSSRQKGDSPKHAAMFIACIRC